MFLGCYTTHMSRHNQETFDPQERAREKQAARDEDWRAWKSGEKTAEEIRRANSWLSDEVIARAKFKLSAIVK